MGGSGPAPEIRPLRLFVAADVPDPVKAGVEAVVAPYRPRVRVARWTQREGWHVTLKFLGSTWPRLLGTVEDAVRQAAARVEPFRTRMTRIGVFPSERRARVIWAGLDDPGGRFAALAADLDALLEEDFNLEPQPFTPHLTLARITPARNVSEFAPGLVGSPVAASPFRVRAVVLYRSRVGPAGPRYEALGSFPLGARAAGA